MSPTQLAQRLARQVKLRAFALGLLLLGVLSTQQALAQVRPPVLISEPTSTRAIALESPTFYPQPFNLTSPFSWNTDGRTRVMLFALNLSLQPGEDLSVVTAQAQDAAGRLYDWRVEYVGPVPGQEWLSALILRFSDDQTAMGDVLVRVSYRGAGSNRVRVGIGGIGGGPPDDSGALPTPAPPYTISGRVTFGSSNLSDVVVVLTGPQTQTVTTDESGAYAFTVNTIGDYVLNVSKPYYDFAPPPRAFVNLSSNHSHVNFNATRQTFTINGQVQDDAGQTLSGSEVTLFNEVGGAIATTTTNAGGNFSFLKLVAGYGYRVVVRSTNFLSFTAQDTGPLGSDLTLDFRGVRRTYAVGGRIVNESGDGIEGVTVNLSGSQTATTTSDTTGNYSFTGVLAGGNYTITPAQTAFYNFTTRSFDNLGGDEPANFTGTLREYTISGRVTNAQDEGMGAVTVSLSGSQSGSVQTDGNGNYSFTVLARGSYTITPSRTNYLFSPQQQSFDNLSGNREAAFAGALRNYLISGRIIAGEGQSLAGVIVSLTGAQVSSVETNANGDYSFSVPAEGDYQLTPAKPHYDFNPLTLAFENLGANQAANFSGTLRHHVISGRVTDGNGSGLVGITVTLGGAQTKTVKTSSDGHYSFNAAEGGDYTITPSIEQELYAFTPSSLALQDLAGAQANNNFAAALTPIPDPAYVLEFDGTPMTVDYGDFWEPYVDLGHFYWEVWAMPGENAGATYMISDGYGGAHALLFGFAFIGTSEAGRYQLYGNVFDGYVSGQHVTFFGSDQGPAPGEWGHFAVGWDGHHIITYFNGVPVGKIPYSSTRATPSPGHGGNRLLIGGSDHNNLVGRIAQVRGYEGRNPLAEAAGPTGGAVETAFAPQTVFSPGGNLTSYYFRPASKVADLSRGFNGITQTGPTHVGKPRGTLFGIHGDCGPCPSPRFVIDPTAPNFAQNIAPPPVAVGTPPPVPTGALLFDSFSRANSTYLFNGRGGLGATESGTIGPKTWLTNQDPAQLQSFGILNGRAVLLANSPALTWVETGQSSVNLDVRVDRRPGFWMSGLDTGLSFRVLDAGNFFFAYTSEGDDANAPRKLAVGYYQDGQRFNLLTGVSMPASWMTLRVVTTNDGQIKLYADAALVASLNSSVMAKANGAGLYNNAPGSALSNRWDNFTVFNAP